MTRDAPTQKQRAGAVDNSVGDNVDAALRAPQAAQVLRHGKSAGVVRLDDDQPLVVGRGHSADVVFVDDDVSRLHAHLKRERGAWRYTDARSQNGSFIARAGAAVAGSVDVDAAFATATAVVDAVDVEVGDVVFVGGKQSALCFVQAAVAPVAVAPLSAAGTQLALALARAARAHGPVLLLGPSGAGKTWAARRIHDESGRRGRFVVLNAGALPNDPTSLRDVFLGHKKGAFTGADKDVDGAFVAADGGTLFLDEIDSLGAAGQAFLLTLLEQTGDLLPLGESPHVRSHKRDVRVVAASKVGLQHAGLRTDLAFRLVDGSLVELPPLSARAKDIPALVHGFLAEVAREDGASAAIDDDALAVCVAAAWPGHVRQLRGVVRLLVREAGDRVVRAAAVHARLAALDRALGSSPSPSSPSPPSSSPPSSSPQKKARQLTAADVEQALAACGGNLQHTADRLGIARNTLVAKLRAFGIRPQRAR